MTNESDTKGRCLSCRRDRRAGLPVASLRPALAAFVATRHPDGGDWICQPCLDQERRAQLVSELERERGELSALESEVASRVASHTASAEHIGEMFVQRQTFGERIADAVARVGGSWPFVIGFALVLATWITLNAKLAGEAFDPYPFILLNLVLSSLAAVQAPIIMMSQNRASARDRLQADEDFKVNLKAELEIGLMHEKIDHLLHVQWERMVAMQEAQLELLEQLASKSDRS